MRHLLGAKIDAKKGPDSKLANICVAIAPSEEQRPIVAYLDDFPSMVNALKLFQAETVVELDAMLPSVLDKFFRGEPGVNQF